MSKRFSLVVLAAFAVLAMSAVPAFAEGYNDPLQYTRASGYFSGPHGGYTTTTNKCADCHSTHYAQGSYMLLRANSREAACDYCHGGGGGSTINIQMDNDYRTGSYSMSEASAVETVSMGYGTGHTLGYEGNAPADIQPAFSDPEGFACFDCHSPHGNSARIMTTMSNPGRAFVGPGEQGRPTTAQTNYTTATAPADPQDPAQYTAWPIKAGFGSGDKDARLENGEWGVDYEYGNFLWDGQAGTGFSLRYRPIWPSGRFLLLKNAHADAQELQADTVVAAADVTATAGVNKYAINWTEPLGPADSNYGGGQDNDNDNAFPFAPASGTSPSGTGGFLSLSEFCVDCHDGTAGASTQKANVWKPNPSDSTTGSYQVAYSHDAQPRH